MENQQPKNVEFFEGLLNYVQTYINENLGAVSPIEVIGAMEMAKSVLIQDGLKGDE